MKTVYCSQCGRKFPAYGEINQNGYSDCRTHIREFMFRNPEFFSKQIHDYSDYFTPEEILNMNQLSKKAGA